MPDSRFRVKLNPLKPTAWDSFVFVLQSSLGSHRRENYADIINNMLTTYQRT